MDIKRSATRGIAVLIVALAAGHLVQTMAGNDKARPAASAGLSVKPKDVVQTAAGSEAAKPVQPAPAESAATILPEAPLTAAKADASPEPKVPAPDQPEAPAAKAPVDVAPVEVAPPAAPDAAAETTAPVVEATAKSCDISLLLMPEPSAMIGVTVLAPCHPDQRLVLRHAGLAVTGQTLATGAAFTSLPALNGKGEIEVYFADGARASAALPMPEVATLRRFGVQWQGDDAFQVHGFEGGATYGDPGHVSAAMPHRPLAGQDATGGFMTLLGDSTVPNPLLAEVYTYPADPAAKPAVVVEAMVTEKTCGRELIGETLNSFGGETLVTDLTLAMPDCDAIGDYMVLKNLVLDVNMAAVN